MVYFRIFQRPDFFRPVPNPICIKKSLQNFTMIVSKILQGGAKRPPPHPPIYSETHIETHIDENYENISIGEIGNITSSHPI